jgi:hypothetical protein
MGERRWKAKKLRKKGKTNKQTSRKKQYKESRKCFKAINRER